MNYATKRDKARRAFYEGFGQSVQDLQPGDQNKTISEVLKLLPPERRNHLLVLAKEASVAISQDDLRKQQEAACKAASEQAATAKEARVATLALRKGFAETPEAQALVAERNGLRYVQIMAKARLGKARADFEASGVASRQTGESKTSAKEPDVGG